MKFLTNEKLTIVGAAGMIGSNMVQTALTMGLTSEICLYDVFSPEGVAEEMRQSGFGDVKITATTDVKEAFHMVWNRKIFYRRTKNRQSYVLSI